jgi:hypothetical protein
MFATVSNASPALGPRDSLSQSGTDPEKRGLAKVIALIFRLATSWWGQFAAYVGAITAAVIAVQELAKHLSGI